MDPNRRRIRNEPKVTPNGSKFGLCLRILTDFLAAHCKGRIVETGGLEPLLNDQDGSLPVATPVLDQLGSLGATNCLGHVNTAA